MVNNPGELVAVIPYLSGLSYVFFSVMIRGMFLQVMSCTRSSGFAGTLLANALPECSGMFGFIRMLLRSTSDHGPCQEPIDWRYLPYIRPM